jgi:hypothetical protein
MKRLTKRWLTADDRALVSECRRRWLETGFSTERADRPAAEHAIQRLYASVDLEAPRVVWCTSPLARALTADFVMDPQVRRAWLGRWHSPPLGTFLSDSLRSSVDHSVLESVKGPLKKRGWKLFAGGDSVSWFPIAHLIRRALRRCVPEGAEATVEDSVVTTVQRSLDLHRVFAPIRRWIRRSVLDSLGEVYSLDGTNAEFGLARWPRIPFLGTFRGASPNEVIGGHFTANGAALTEYLRVIGGAGATDDVLSNLGLLAASAGSLMPRGDVCWVVERPVRVLRDEAGRLHSAKGPALEYEDGYSLHFWHGVAVDARWLSLGERIDPHDVLTWPQGEQRRALAEIAGGWASVISRLPTRVVNEDHPSIGTLLEYRGPTMSRALFLRVLCGTGRTFVLPVPSGCRTAREANAWTYGIEPHDYEPEVRT